MRVLVGRVDLTATTEYYCKVDAKIKAGAVIDEVLKQIVIRLSHRAKFGKIVAKAACKNVGKHL